jgi:hypothetical protein
MTLVVAVVARRGVCWVLIVRTIAMATMMITIAGFGVFRHLSNNNISISISGRTGYMTTRRRTLVALIELRSYVPRRGGSGISIGGRIKTMVVVTKEVNICNNMEDEMKITTADIPMTSMLLPLLTHRVRLRSLDSMTATINEAVRVSMVGINGGVSSSSSSKIGINLHIPHRRRQKHHRRGKLRRLNP